MEGVVLGDADLSPHASDAYIVLLLPACTAWSGNPAREDWQAMKRVAPAELMQERMPTPDEELVLPLRDFIKEMKGY